MQLIQLNRIRFRKGQGREITMLIPKDIRNQFPDFFFADVLIENIKKRNKTEKEDEVL